jgi:5-methyltetrahydrofolate--homocysteine methyltransferase
VTIGAEQPVAVIGERINPTGRAALTQSLSRGDTAVAVRDAVAQAQAGASILDVNVGVPGLDQASAMAATVRALQAATDLPLCLDSADPRVLEAGLAAYDGKALVNSVTGEAAVMAAILPVVRAFGAAVIALPMDEDGIPPSPKARLRVAERILAEAARLGIAPDDVVLDPLTMAVGADAGAGRVTLDTIALYRERLGANVTLGASNVSHGLPARPALNAAFAAMAIARGATCPIANPLDRTVMDAVRAANLCLGHDSWAASWIRAYRTGRVSAG